MPDSGTILPAFASAGDLWPDVPTTSYSEANRIGRDRAEDVLEVMRRRDAPSLLGHVVEAMIDSGNFDGVAIGFCHTLSVTLMQPPIREFVQVPAEREFARGRKMRHLAVVGL